jgi:hypothetical protein
MSNRKPSEKPSEEAIRLKRGQAERNIRNALLAFTEDTGVKIIQVNIDLRDFANYATEIFMEGE